MERAAATGLRDKIQARQRRRTQGKRLNLGRRPLCLGKEREFDCECTQAILKPQVWTPREFFAQKTIL